MGRSWSRRLLTERSLDIGENTKLYAISLFVESTFADSCATTQGRETSTNSIASIYAWTRGLIFMGKRDGNEKLVQFAKDLEQCCVDAVDIDGVMTKDLALSIYGKGMKREHYATTEGFLDHIRVSFIFVSDLSLSLFSV